MEPTLNIWILFFLFAAAHGVFLATVLFLHKRGNRIANRFLAVFILCFAIRLIELSANWSKYLLEFPHLFAATTTFLYLYGPLLFLYASTLASEKVELSPKILLHFLPFVIHVAYVTPFYAQSSAFKIDYLKRNLYALRGNENAALNLEALDVHFFILLFQIPHMLLYTLKTLQLLRTETRKLNGLLTLEKIKLRWLQYLTGAFGALWTAWFLYHIAIILGVEKYYVALDYGTTTAFVVIIYLIGYMTLRQPELFSGVLALKQLARYEKSTLSSEKADRLLEKLITIMENEKLFMKSELKLQHLAARLTTPTHHLSQIINEKLNRNFYDFINYYRVEEAKRMLLDSSYSHFTILAIAFEVGFNNKASFNSAFKKHTGLTPSQFRKHLLKTPTPFLS